MKFYLLVILTIVSISFTSAIICDPSLPGGCPGVKPASLIIINDSTLNVNDSTYWQGYTPVTYNTSLAQTYVPYENANRDVNLGGSNTLYSYGINLSGVTTPGGINFPATANFKSNGGLFMRFTSSANSLGVLYDIVNNGALVPRDSSLGGNTTLLSWNDLFVHGSLSNGSGASALINDVIKYSYNMTNTNFYNDTYNTWAYNQTTSPYFYNMTSRPLYDAYAYNQTTPAIQYTNANSCLTNGTGCSSGVYNASYVPYVNAVDNVNLGTHNINVSDAIIGSNVNLTGTNNVFIGDGSITFRPSGTGQIYYDGQTSYADPSSFAVQNRFKTTSYYGSGGTAGTIPASMSLTNNYQYTELWTQAYSGAMSSLTLYGQYVNNVWRTPVKFTSGKSGAGVSMIGSKFLSSYNADVTFTANNTLRTMNAIVSGADYSVSSAANLNQTSGNLNENIYGLRAIITASGTANVVGSPNMSFVGIQTTTTTQGTSGGTPTKSEMGAQFIHTMGTLNIMQDDGIGGKYGLNMPAINGWAIYSNGGNSYFKDNITTSGSLNVTENVWIGGNISVKRPYWNGYDNSTQANDVTNGQVMNVSNNNNYDSYGIHVVGNQNLTFDKTGDYLCILSPEFYEPNGQTGIITFWMQKNGVDVAWSNSRYTLASNTYNAPAIPFQFDIDTPATDNIRFKWWSDNANTIIYSSGTLTSPTRPSIPGVILNCQKVSEIT